MKLAHRHLLGIENLSVNDIELILDTAAPFKKLFTQSIKRVPTLRGKTVAFLFYEPSTRTRSSFELAAKRLSADTLDLSVAQSSVQKGESLIDTGKTLQAMKVDFIIIRHRENGAAKLLADHLPSVHIVNAGDGMQEHPTQALLDVFTLREKKGKIKGLNITIIGDIAHSRVARSNLLALSKLGANITLCGPKTLIPAELLKGFKSLRVEHDLKTAIKNADALNVLRIQKERMEQGLIPSFEQYFKEYGIDEQKCKWLKKDCIILHPGPMNRGIEISSAVADGSRSVVLEQVTNGIAVRMSVMYLLAGS